MTYSEELLAVAKRIFCFGTPEEALQFPIRFLTYAMTYASNEDIEILRKYFRRRPGHSSRLLSRQILNTGHRDINLPVWMGTAGEAESPTFQVRVSRTALPPCNFLLIVLYTYTMQETTQTVTAAGGSYRE